MRELDEIKEISDLSSHEKNRFSGMNDEPNGEDLLYYKSYAEILANIIIKKTIDPPVTFGIYSSWGNGKSFLLNQIEKFIKDIISKNIEEDKNVVQVVVLN